MDEDMHTLRTLRKQRFVPGTDQKAILDGLENVERILSRTQEHPREKQLRDAALYLLEDVADKVTRQLLHPNTQDPQVRRSLHEILEHTGTIQESYRTARNARFLVPVTSTIQERAIRSAGITIQAFKHIPYGYTETGAPQQLINVLHKSSTEAHREKHYHVIAPRGRSETIWNLDMIGAPRAWNSSRGTGVRVGIIDTGCDYTHSEIAGRFGAVKGYNFIANTDDPMDDNGHGTHVAGTVAGDAVGVAPEALLFALKFLDGDGWGTEVGFIKSAEWAIDNHLEVLNGSFGSAYASGAEQAICDELLRQGIIFSAAAGNDGNWSYGYPASYDSVLSIAAVDKNRERAEFSQMNDALSLSAPGVGVYSCVPGGYTYLNGTSMACPHTAGSAALVLCNTKNPGYTRELLTQSAETLGDSEEYGAGLVRPDRALELAAFVTRWAA